MFARENAGSFGNIVYDPEKLLHVLQAAGVPIVPAQHLVRDKALAENSEDMEVLEFVASCVEGINKIEKIVEYCAAIATGKASVDRYSVTTVHELCKSARDMYNPHLNPLIKPSFVGSTFGKFTVEMVSEEAKDLQERG